MKIVCDSCATKYSIADEKVRGKVFKIRCKKCSHIIVVRGTSEAAPAPAPAAAEGVWHIVVDGEQVGPLMDADIRSRIDRGELNADTYIWKEGFADWMKISAVPEFADAVPAAPPAAHGEQQFVGENRTVARQPDAGLLRQAAGANGGLFGSAGGEEQDDPFAAKPTTIAPSGHAASAFAASGDDDVFGSRSRPSGGGDLFTAPAMAPAPFSEPSGGGGAVPDFDSPRAAGGGGRVENLTAQRNENSVLFSLSNLQSLAMPTASAGGAQKLGHANSATDGSGLIDIRAMAATTLGAPTSHRADEELPTFGFTGGSVAPVLLPTSGTSSNSKLIFALIGVFVLLLGAIGVMAYFVFFNKPPQVAVVPAPSVPPIAPPVAAPPPAASGPGVAATPGAPAGSEPAAVAAGEKAPSSVSSKPRKSGGTSKGGDRGGGSKGTEVAAAAKSGAQGTKPTVPEPAAAPAPKKSADPLDDILNSVVKQPKPRVDDGDDAPKKRAPAAEASKGQLPQGAIVSGMRAIMPKISECYTQYKVPGQAMVAVAITKSGKVGSATVSGKFAGTPTGSCVERAVKSATFPPSDGISINYPFLMK